MNRMKTFYQIFPEILIYNQPRQIIETNRVARVTDDFQGMSMSSLGGRRKGSMQNKQMELKKYYKEQYGKLQLPWRNEVGSLMTGIAESTVYEIPDSPFFNLKRQVNQKLRGELRQPSCLKVHSGLSKERRGQFALVDQVNFICELVERYGVKDITAPIQSDITNHEPRRSTVMALLEYTIDERFKNEIPLTAGRMNILKWSQTAGILKRVVDKLHKTAADKEHDLMMGEWDGQVFGELEHISKLSDKLKSWKIYLGNI